jgi:CheY-like chemotaxis protein
VTRPKLLLADDSVTIRKVVELTFADEGVEVTTVADSEAAMARFLDDQPNIVLVDVGLPGTTGYDICEMIKSDETTSHIPVLLLVGSFEPFDQDAAERSGADGFLTKPFHSIRDLVNRVHELLGTRQKPPVDEVIDFDTTLSADGDNDDIDDLYERSFAETVPIDNFETVTGFEVDEAFPGETNSEEALFAEEKTPSEMVRVTDEEASAEQVATGEEYTPANEEPSEREETATGSEIDAVDEPVRSVPALESDWLDDEMIETVRSASPDEMQVAESEAVAAVGKYDEAPAAEVDIEPIKEFDWSPAAIVTAADEKEIGAAAGSGSPFDPLIPLAEAHEEHVTEELPDLRTEKIPEVPIEAGNGMGEEPDHDMVLDEAVPVLPPVVEPSTELIDLIVSRVMERLSDRAVREVAQEAVPRIAERLMREALEEDRNK